MFWWELKRRFYEHRWLLSEIGLFFLMAIVLTWPVILSPSTIALGSDHGDGMKHLWTLWWMRSSVWDDGQFPFFTDSINYPTGMDLYPIEPLNGLLVCFFPWANVVSLSNFLIIFNLTLTGIAGAWFGRLISGSRWGGVTSGILIEGSAVMAFFVHVGVGELSHLWWIPLGLGCLIKARETQEWKWFLLVSASLIGAIFSCFYLGFFLALSVLIWSIATIWAGRDTPMLFLKYVVAAGIAIMVVLPLTKSFSSSYKVGGEIDEKITLTQYMMEDHGQPDTDNQANHRLDPKQIIQWQRTIKDPRGENERSGPNPQFDQMRAYSGGRYIGFMTIGLGLLGLIMRPKKAIPFLIIAGVGTALACGSYFVYNGEEVVLGTVQNRQGQEEDVRVAMPFFWLNRILGYYAEPLNFPPRFLAMTVVGFAGMAALAIRNWKLFLLVPLTVIEIGNGQMLDWPWATFQPRETSVLKQLRGIDDRAIVDLGVLARSDQQNRKTALSAQIAHGKKTNTIPIERIECFARDGVHFAKGLEFFNNFVSLYNATAENPAKSFSSNISDYRGDMALLQEAGFGWIVVHNIQGIENERPSLPRSIYNSLNSLLGKPHIDTPGIGVWEIPEVSYTEQELEKWKAKHAADIKLVSRTEKTNCRPDGGMGRQLR